MNLKAFAAFLLMLSAVPSFSQNTADAYNVIPVTSIEPGSTDFSDLQPLRAMIGNSRIVMLGEPHHDAGNIFKAKTRLIKFLHKELGFNMIAFESGFYDLKKASDAIDAGENVKSALFSSIYTSWAMTREFEPLMDYISENRSGLKVAGFDSRFSSENVYEYLYDDILEEASKCSIPVVEGELQYWMEIVEEMAEKGDLPPLMTLTVFKLVHKHITEAVACSPEPGPNQQFLLQLLDNIIATARDYHQKNLWQRGRNNNVREKLMAANLVYWARKNPQAKIICWGSNSDFFSNTIFELNNEEAREFRPMGNYVKNALGKGEVFFIAFTGSKPTGKTENYTIEEALRDKGAKPGIVNVKDIQAAVFYSTCMDGKEEVSRSWKHGMDAIFYVGNLQEKTFQLPDLSDEFAGNDSLLMASLKTKSYAMTRPRVAGEKNQDISRWQSVFVMGKVEDDVTHEAIPYANISIEGTSTGTSSNSQGEFFLKIPEKQAKDNLKISFVGYEVKFLPAKQFVKHRTVGLKPGTVTVSEVVVSGKMPDAVTLMRQAIDNIPKNYYQSAFTEIRCSRSVIRFDRDTSTYLYDAVSEQYDHNGFAKIPMFPIRYKGFGKVRNIRVAKVDSLRRPLTDFVAEIKRPVAPWVRFEPMNNRRNCFLNKSLLRKYDFQYGGRVAGNDEDYYVIMFRCKNPNMRNCLHSAAMSYSGEIHISAKDFAFLRISTIAVLDRKQFLNEVPDEYRDKDYTFFEKEDFTYKKVGDYYYLDMAKVSTDWLEMFGENESYLMEVSLGKRPRSESSIQLPPGQKYKPEDWSNLPLND